MKKARVGLVVSDKMDKTVVVQVERRLQHPKYPRIVRRSSRLKAHDAENSCKVGDRVRIEESRPLSRDKRWIVTQIVEKAK
jgi:small subunit ribosomal protein S17